MFKIPDWGKDVPKSNIDVNKLFPSKNKSKGKKSQNNIENKGNVRNNLKNKGKVKPPGTGKVNKPKNVKQPKYKAKKFVNVSPKINNFTKKTENNQTAPSPGHNIDLQNCDTDKLDEVILDAKKKNLIDSYKKEDNEEELFTESDEKKLNIVKKNKEINDKELSLAKKIKKDKTNKKKLKNQLMQSKTDSNSSMVITKEQKVISPQNKKFKFQKANKNSKNQLDSTENSVNINKSKKGENKVKLNVSKSVNVKDNLSVLNSNVKSSKTDHKKGLLKNLLQSHRTPINVSGNNLRERMLEKLNAAKFRFLNEKLYTSSGSEALKLFQEDPAAFQTYHQGYQQQVKKWPVNPLDVVVKRIKNLPKTHLIADLGCGEAALSKRVTQTVRSFDLVATAPGVEVCDMAHTPLLTASMDVAVYCLALMGTDLTQFLVEANRILKTGGHLLIAEVESRFDDVDSFTKEVQKLGFTLRKLDKTHKVFYFMEFTKTKEAPVKKSKLPSLHLKPCVYKRR